MPQAACTSERLGTPDEAILRRGSSSRNCATFKGSTRPWARPVRTAWGFDYDLRPMKPTSRSFLSSFGAACLLVATACSSTNETAAGDAGAGGGGGSASCEGAPVLTKNEFCTAGANKCTLAPNASPSSCRAPRVIDACCSFVQAPSQELVRGTGLNRNSSTDATLNLGCLDAPGEIGTPKTVDLKGFLRVFSSGGDSAGVKIEIFKEGANGALGEPVGTAVTTPQADHGVQTPKPDWLKKCPDGGCTFHAFTYKGIPTETPLVIKTSDAASGEQWAPLYDYNIFFANAAVKDGNVVEYDPAALAATDINTVASAAGGFTPRADRGLIAGEVHDCGDVRVSGATVDTDLAHEGDMFYFGENESDPLPDKSRGALGTSKLGLFGTLNLPTGQPIRISAVGKVAGQTVLLGTHVVQTFPGSVTALSFRGRRPWQK